MFVSRLVYGAGCGIRLYRFLIIAFSSTLKNFGEEMTDKPCLLNIAIVYFCGQCEMNFVVRASINDFHKKNPCNYNS